MAQQDANWFSSYFGWGRQGGDIPRKDTGRTIGAAAATERSDEPTPKLKQVWRTMLRKDASHPNVGGS